jgi:putative membrane-bound dehydrogenase-like protein
MTFESRGRLYVGMGPQYRKPTPETPGDSVILLVDHDGDGRADTRKEFVTGLNCIQGLAWKGNALWIANSPDLTVVRDLDGDDEADEYIRLYTDLGNLEHALHGLNWAPDGRLYMSKGNSKGLSTGPDRVAPGPFRELWGVQAGGLPDLPAPVSFTRETYRRNYHHPADDWGREGGILRCNNDGGQLEIVARGFRNPWDIAFDDEFNWLGTDNDQTHGDKIFSPFFGAHFGWGHPWSFDWEGTDHPPTVPASGPLFEGSGAGIVYCGLERYPEKYRGAFLINDWLLRRTYLFRPEWHGALLSASGESLEVLATAGTGRSMERSHGRRFDPVDIEIGPDEAIYISSWGREYGASWRDGELANEGRIYRLRPRSAPPIAEPADRYARPVATWTTSELIRDLGSHLPVRRANAQEELLRRNAIMELREFLGDGQIRKSLQTWAMWTLGRMRDPDLDGWFSRTAVAEEAPLNLRIQSIRILADRGRVPESLQVLLREPQPRIRFETLLAVARARPPGWNDGVLAMAAAEADRLVYYAAWKAFQRLLTPGERVALLRDERPGVRRAAVLGLLEEDALGPEALQKLARDSDVATAALAQKRLRGKAEVEIRGRPLVRAVVDRKQRAETEAVLGWISHADAERGRRLFRSPNEAGCIACHRLEGHGNAFAPDLTGIALRADTEFLVRSIIEPDAAITEGFAQQVFSTKDGEVYSGLVLEETGAAIKLAMANGQVVTLPTGSIAAREGSIHSAMPANYAELLGPGQVADLVAYLREASVPQETPEFPDRFRLERRPGELVIALNNQPVATYLYEHSDLTRPAWVNLRTPSGRRVTREFPAPEGSDHRWMHPGVAMSFGDVSGNDPWRLKARVRHVGFLQEPEIGSHGVTFAVRNHYLSERPGDIVCIEDCRYRVVGTAEGFILEIDSEFWNASEAFYFGNQEESGLAVRVAPWLSVKGEKALTPALTPAAAGMGEGEKAAPDPVLSHAKGEKEGTVAGTILNDRGERNEAGTWGQEFRWIDYSGFEDDRRVGVLIVPHPENPRTCWSHSRDYGVVVANPLPRPGRGEETAARTWVARGERYRLRFGVQIYGIAMGIDSAGAPRKNSL